MSRVTTSSTPLALHLRVTTQCINTEYARPNDELGQVCEKNGLDFDRGNLRPSDFERVLLGGHTRGTTYKITSSSSIRIRPPVLRYVPGPQRCEILRVIGKVPRPDIRSQSDIREIMYMNCHKCDKHPTGKCRQDAELPTQNQCGTELQSRATSYIAEILANIGMTEAKIIVHELSHNQ
ncbi:hypothetical protein K503DRAFT_785216 [Rhizopogon vinicolor AM-OR11-026]|uniref:Uncharacterized protein n=1 Tax=Rhizopogon vinicolor AM-OR11-026 TaxID=1314800 RepID=A0A1B7MRP5_9AGAM|nr:hypothetical protein K503DRAFT_785216 [Rhizopogon vinicolor AM-OR11-026]